MLDFFDKDRLQLFEFERFLFDHVHDLDWIHPKSSWSRDPKHAGMNPYAGGGALKIVRAPLVTPNWEYLPKFNNRLNAETWGIILRKWLSDFL